jgi:DNA-binding PadR family transcriptional regulator
VLLSPVLDKRVVSSGRGRRSYQLTVNGEEEGRRVRLRVSRELYDRLRPGDPVRFDLRRGGLGIYYWWPG